MKIKTAELKDLALDWAVTACEGKAQGHPPLGERKDLAEGITPYGVKLAMHYSSDWSQGGPIIEREGIDLHRVTGALWSARWWANNFGMAKNPAQRFKHNVYADGPTPLIAAMRCYVASKLGDEVDVPEELCQPTV